MVFSKEKYIGVVTILSCRPHSPGFVDCVYSIHYTSRCCTGKDIIFKNNNNQQMYRVSEFVFKVFNGFTEMSYGSVNNYNSTNCTGPGLPCDLDFQTLAS